jgi:hypothetical protein
MSSVILHNDANGQPIIFLGSRSWQRVAREDSSNGERMWFERNADRPPVTDKKLSHFMDRIVRHPEKVQTTDDAPELTADDTAAAEWINTRIARLDTVIIRASVRRREDRILIGRALLEQKKILSHGKFKSHVSDAFSSFFSLRTAERYMELAREEDAASEVDKLSLLKSASDDGAKVVKTATKRAQAEVASQSTESKSQKRSALYKLPVALNPEDQKAVDALRKTPNWVEAEQNIVEEIRRQCVKFGAYGEEDQKDHENNSADA